MTRDERPREQDAVRTPIVVGHPPGSGKALGPIPRGLEVLVKKAVVDPEFRQVLLEKRARAADEIGLQLEPAEVAMLNAVPAEQLQTIIANTNVSEVSRAAFLGRAAAVMLAALGVSAAGCSRKEATDGIRPDRIPIKGEQPDRPSKDEPTDAVQSRQRPDRVYLCEGCRPPTEDKPPTQPSTTQDTKPQE